jgi:hypothetical protein
LLPPSLALSAEVDALAINRTYLAVIYNVFYRSELAIGSRSGVALSGRAWYVRNVWNAEFVVFAPPLENLLSCLSEMNKRSAPFDKQSTCQILSPHTEAFHIISCFKIRIKERIAQNS